jgi:hypothetical protein
MSNVILTSVLVKDQLYKLSALPSTLSKIWGIIPDLNTNDTFKYLGKSHIVNGEFLHVRTGNICQLGTHLLLNSDRFYYPSNERLALKTALFICSDTTLYPYGTSQRSLRQAVKAGTIFTKFIQEGKYYIVEDNAGNKFRAYASSSRPIMDIDYVAEIKNTAQVEDKQPKISHMEIKADEQEIVIHKTFSLLGKSFTNEEDATYVANLLKALKSHTFKSPTDFKSFQELVEDFDIDVAKT